MDLLENKCFIANRLFSTTKNKIINRKPNTICSCKPYIAFEYNLLAFVSLFIMKNNNNKQICYITLFFDTTS